MPGTLFFNALGVVARDGPIREANQDSEALRRGTNGEHRSESIEPSTRGINIRGPYERTPAQGRDPLRSPMQVVYPFRDNAGQSEL